MIEIHLYGALRRHGPDARASEPSVVHLAAGTDETVGTVLERVGIACEDLAHIFLNGSILRTENSMAFWLRYQEANGSGLDTPVRDGDRLGLFARDMALLVV